VQKADDSPLTAADGRAHEIIEAHLAAAYPDVLIVSEEGDEGLWAKRCAAERFFLIDPIDGTQEFIDRDVHFSVNLAYVERGRVRAGCLLFPALGELYTGFEGGGARLEYLQSGNVVPLRVSNFSLKDTGLRVVCSRSRHNAQTAAFIERLHKARKTHIGASMKFMHVAAGNAEMYPRFGSAMKEWDVAASQAIVEAAGGSVVLPQTGQTLEYGKTVDIVVRDFLAQGRVID